MAVSIVYPLPPADGWVTYIHSAADGCVIIYPLPPAEGWVIYLHFAADGSVNRIPGLCRRWLGNLFTLCRRWLCQSFTLCRRWLGNLFTLCRRWLCNRLPSAADGWVIYEHSAADGCVFIYSLPTWQMGMYFVQCVRDEGVCECVCVSVNECVLVRVSVWQPFLAARHDQPFWEDRQWVFRDNGQRKEGLLVLAKLRRRESTPGKNIFRWAITETRNSPKKKCTTSFRSTMVVFTYAF